MWCPKSGQVPQLKAWSAKQGGIPISAWHTAFSFISPQDNVTVPKKTLCSWVILGLYSTITLDSFSVAPLSGQLLPLCMCVYNCPSWEAILHTNLYWISFQWLQIILPIIHNRFKSSYASESACNISHSQGKLDFVARVCTVFQDDDQNGFINNSF